MNSTNPGTPSVTFETVVSSFGNNTGIVVPGDVIDALGAGKRPPVDVELNGYRSRTTIGSMKGQQLISVSAAVRKETGLAGGDTVNVTLTVDRSTRPIEIPTDFAEALSAEPEADAFFATLSNSLQRYHVDQATSAKKPDTRRRRIGKIVSLFLAGKKR